MLNTVCCCNHMMMSYDCSATKMEVNFVCLDPDTSLPRMLTMITRGSTYKNYQTFYSRTNKFLSFLFSFNKICKQASPEKFRYLPAIRNVKSCSELFPHSSTPGRGSNKTLNDTNMIILISSSNKKYSKLLFNEFLPTKKISFNSVGKGC